MHNLLQRIGFFQGFEQNSEGRDFVVGDLHGSYHLLDQALAIAHFDFARDRLFSVGDLTDRGLDSPRCLEFLRQPWFHAITGNHEQVLIDMSDEVRGDPRALQALVKNIRETDPKKMKKWGWHWVEKVDAETLKSILDEFRKLPTAIELQTEAGPVGIIHAHAPEGMSWQQLVAGLKAGDTVLRGNVQWNRERIKDNDESGIPGIGRVFVGHNVTPKRVYGNVINLDSGAGSAPPEGMKKVYLTMINALVSEEIMRQPHIGGDIDVRDVPSLPKRMPNIGHSLRNEL